MTVHLRSADSVTLPSGGLWDLRVCVRTWDGYADDDVPVITVTKPDASTEALTVETISTGEYRATFAPADDGRYTAAIATADSGTTYAAAYVTDVTLGVDMPTADDLDVYMGEHSYSDDDLQDALDAEASAQRARCKIGSIYPPDLRSALLRRAQRNLVMRGLPLAMPQGDSGGSAFLPGNDPEVRRLEAPYRKRKVG